MANILKFEKVTTLPTTYTPSTLYMLKTATGFELHVSSSDGSTIAALDSNTQVKPTQYINSIVAGTLHLINGVNRWYAPALSVNTISTIEMFVSTPSVGADIKINVNKNGTLFGTYTLPAGSYYMSASVTNFSVNGDAVVGGTGGDYLTYDVVQIGSSTPGADLQIRFSY